MAIDIDPNLLEVSRHRLSEGGVTNCDYVAGDAYDLGKLIPGQVDFVFMANAFHGVPRSTEIGPRGARNTLTGRSFRDCQLASPPARANTGLGRTARTKNGTEIVAGTDRQGR